MTSTFTPRPAGLHPSRARNAAAFSLLQTLPPGTDLLFDEVTVPAGDRLGKAQAGASARALSFRKHYSGRNGLTLQVRTRREGTVVRSYVTATKPAPAGVDLTTTYVQPTPNRTATANPTTATVTVNVTAPENAEAVAKKLAETRKRLAGYGDVPVANPKRTKASEKSGKRRYVRRTESYAKHLETGDLLARGYFLPQYKTTKLVTAWPFKNTSVSKETLQRRAYRHAQQLNKLASESDRPFKFVVRTTASAVRINVVLTD